MEKDAIRKTVLAELRRVAPEVEEGELQPDRLLRENQVVDYLAAKA